MYEGNFFKALLTKLRSKGLQAYASFPVKTSYPAVEVELLESKIFESQVMIHFNLRLCFDTAAYDDQVRFCHIVESAVLEKLSLLPDGIACTRKLSQKSLARQKGELFTVLQEYEAIIRHS